MRTYDPFVNSPGGKCFVFSGSISLQAHSEEAKALLGSAKLMRLSEAHELCVPLHISAAATGMRG
jgi:hypothetical protein